MHEMISCEVIDLVLISMHVCVCSLAAEKGAKPKKVSDVPRNADGSIRFPVVVGAMNVHSLGNIVYDRPSWHSDKYLYPAGFKTSRAYASLTQPEGRCLYYSEIVDDGKVCFALPSSAH